MLLEKFIIVFEFIGYFLAQTPRLTCERLLPQLIQSQSSDFTELNNSSQGLE